MRLTRLRSPQPTSCRIRPALLLITLLLLAGCGGSQVYIGPEYQGVRMDGKKLAVRISLAPPPEVSTPETYYDVLAELSEEVYTSYVQTELNWIVRRHARFDIVVFPRSDIEMAPDRVKLAGSEKAIAVHLPEGGLDIRMRSRGAEFTLFLEDLSIALYTANPGDYYFKTGHDGQPLADIRSTGGKPARMIHQGKFTLWDNAQGKLVSSGLVHVHTPVDSPLQKELFSSALDEIMAHIFSNSPFTRN